MKGSKAAEPQWDKTIPTELTIIFYRQDATTAKGLVQGSPELLQSCFFSWDSWVPYNHFPLDRVQSSRTSQNMA